MQTVAIFSATTFATRSLNIESGERFVIAESHNSHPQTTKGSKAEANICLETIGAFFVAPNAA